MSAEPAQTKQQPTEQEKDRTVIQCVCGTYIKSPADYDLVFLKKQEKEIDIICPNPDCYLHEIGFIKFDVKNDKPVLVDARFYSPFCTWNASRMGREDMEKKLKQHLIWLVEHGVDWKEVMNGLKKYQEERKKAEEERKAPRTQVTGSEV
ncbi:hypothetical protein PQ610_00780 [Tardisphaera miroshnichenkoae]